ncbi:MAG: hypothetical protein GF398_06925 [Chitinivibrionales bacterium]|nr:hypothetical protein [Chitinivibrionales bacterium]
MKNRLLTSRGNIPVDKIFCKDSGATQNWGHVRYKMVSRNEIRFTGRVDRQRGWQPLEQPRKQALKFRRLRKKQGNPDAVAEFGNKHARNEEVGAAEG